MEGLFVKSLSILVHSRPSRQCASPNMWHCIKRRLQSSAFARLDSESILEMRTSTKQTRQGWWLLNWLNHDFMRFMSLNAVPPGLPTASRRIRARPRCWWRAWCRVLLGLFHFSTCWDEQVSVSLLVLLLQQESSEAIKQGSRLEV